MNISGFKDMLQTNKNNLNEMVQNNKLSVIVFFKYAIFITIILLNIISKSFIYIANRELYIYPLMLLYSFIGLFQYFNRSVNESLFSMLKENIIPILFILQLSFTYYMIVKNKDFFNIYNTGIFDNKSNYKEFNLYNFFMNMILIILLLIQRNNNIMMILKLFLIFIWGIIYAYLNLFLKSKLTKDSILEKM